MMMTNGFGAVLGSSISGLLIGRDFTSDHGVIEWHDVWLSFAAYSLVVAVLFAILFRYRHVRAGTVGPTRSY